MHIEHYKDTIYITGQITPEDVHALVSDYGFVAIVNNRIDGEADDQPESRAIEAASREEGVAYYYLPMRDRQDITSEALAARDALLAEHRGEKVLFFCRTGGRSEALLAHE